MAYAWTGAFVGTAGLAAGLVLRQRRRPGRLF
jgi:MYXO-CTERM domain-containing protein